MPVPFGTVPGFLPGASSLVEQLDHRLLVILRDGRHLVGVLRSFDQFSNLVLEDTSERRFLKTRNMYAEERLGLFIVKGDNVVMMGEVNDNDENDEDEEKDETLVEGGPTGTNSKGGGGAAGAAAVKLRKVTLAELVEAEKGVDVKAEMKLKTCWDFDLDLV